MKHSHNCTMSFGRHTKEAGVCLRCDELKQGAAPRSGWQKEYYAKRKRDEEMFLRNLKNHNCEQAKCGPVCTFGDW